MTRPIFKAIDCQAKDANDWRAFLYFFLSDGNYAEHEVRGYGPTEADAKADAWRKFYDRDYLNRHLDLDLEPE
jgi:hypothetical protein